MKASGIGTSSHHSGMISVLIESAPLLKLAVPHIAHRAIRNAGTLGGSIANADLVSSLADDGLHYPVLDIDTDTEPPAAV